MAVVGLGGVGSYAAEALARAGVGRLRIIDCDKVKPSDINRQLIALSTTVGMPKVQAAADRLAAINPQLRLEPVQAFFHFDTKTDGWAEAYDVGAGQATIGFYETHDGGVNWNQVMLSSPPEAMLPGFLHTCNICGDAVYYDPTRLIIVPGDMATEPSGSVRLSISSDLGMTWKKIVLPFPSSKYAYGLVSPGDPVFFDAQNGLLPVVIVKFNSDGSKAYSDLAVYITHDGGLTWKNSSAVVEDVGWMGRIDFASSDDAFVACGNNLCVSHDGTATWQTVTSNLNFSENGGTEYVWRFDFVSASLGWAITTDGTNYSLWKTADSGQTWTNLSPEIHP